MIDRENVIKGLDICANGGGCKDGIQNPLCPYSSVVGCDLNQILLDALALLKEQEAVIRCKDCKHRPKEPDLETYESGFDLEFPDNRCPCECDDGFYSWYPDDNWFCGNGERKD